MPVFALTVGSLGDILATAGLAIKIVKALHESGHSSAECDVLTLELQALQKVLILTEYAIQHYKSSALGQILANVVGPEVAQCHLAMQGFATEIDTYRQVLGSTVIGRLWGRVVWTMSDKVVSLQAKLTSHRGKLSMILVALNSVALMEHGDEMRTLQVAVGELSAFLRQGPRSLGQLHDDTVRVVDALGMSIPVPILFCSTWEGFDHILRGYFKDRIGQDYVERGDYHVLRAEDSQVINPSELASTVEPGMVIEMSIILRQKFAIGDNEKACPRCRYINSSRKLINGWIECRKCSGSFQFAVAAREEERDENDPENESDGVEADDYNENEIISPASGSSTSQEASSSEQGPRGDNVIQFFRRINLICTIDQIHAALGFSHTPHLNYDVSLLPSLSLTVLAESATHPPLPTLTIVHPYLPWPITITPLSVKPGAFITVSAVLRAIYHSLRLNVTPAEFKNLPSMEAQDRVNEAYRHRYKKITDATACAEEKAKGVKRVDFLMGKHRFMGLTSTQRGPTIWELHVS